MNSVSEFINSFKLSENAIHRQWAQELAQANKYDFGDYNAFPFKTNEQLHQLSKSCFIVPDGFHVLACFGDFMFAHVKVTGETTRTRYGIISGNRFAICPYEQTSNISKDQIGLAQKWEGFKTKTGKKKRLEATGQLWNLTGNILFAINHALAHGLQPNAPIYRSEG